jgi:hypothetical protein
LLKTSTLGLPSFLEADNKEYSLKEIFNQFTSLDRKARSLVIRNVHEKPEFDHVKVNNSVFVSSSHYPPKIRTHYGYGNKVKRYLPITTNCFELNEILIVKYVNAQKAHRAGISIEQFKADIYKKEYKYVGVCGPSWNNNHCMLHENLKDSGFVAAVFSPIFGLEYLNQLTLYVKEEK